MTDDIRLSKWSGYTPERFGLSHFLMKESFAGYFSDRFVIPQLLDLQKRADEHGLKIVFFKGIIEKYDTYKPLHLHRPQNDVDLLVSPESVNGFCHICKAAGFTTSYGPIDDVWIDEQLSNLTHHHLPPFHKKLLNGSLDLCIEVHTVLNPSWNYLPNRNELIASIISNRTIDVETGLYMMATVDRFVLSSLFFTNDFLPALTRFYYIPHTILFNCKALADAYLIFNKYRDVLSINKIAERVNFFGLDYNMIFSLRVINRLFDDDLFKDWSGCLISACDDSIRPNLLFSDLAVYNAALVFPSKEDFKDIDFYKDLIAQCLSLNKTAKVFKSF